MPSLGKITLDGKSGKAYRFTVFPLGTKIRKRAGLYAVANRSHDDSAGHHHQVLFVGQTEDLSQPFEKHHKAQAFEASGANCICFHAEDSEECRIEKERDLVASMQPVCND